MQTKATVNSAHHPLRGYPPSLRGVPARRSRALALGALLIWLGLGAARPAWALTTIYSDTTISTTISGDVQVTGSANINIVPGGVITGNLTAYNSSAVTLTGGTVNGSVTANDSSTVTVLDASTVRGGLTANETCTVNISGGSISASDFGLTGVLVDGGGVSISGGSISGHEGVRVNGGMASISGGTISGDLVTAGPGVTVNGGTASISGGSLTGANTVTVQSGTVSISSGSISGSSSAVSVESGTASITGGSISATFYGVWLEGGTANISGGSIRGNAVDVEATLGAANISGGSFAADTAGPALEGGTVSLFGCGLQLSGGSLTGTLQDGTSINASTSGLAAGNLHNQLPQISPPANLTVPTDPNSCTATVNPGTATAAGSDCGSIPTVSGARSDPSPLSAAFPVGTTTIYWTATDSFGQHRQVQQTITVVDTQKPALTLTASQTLNATSNAGATVSFTVTATDNCGTPTVICTNQNGQTVSSGMTFPIGTTVVTCTATDGSGNQSAGSFSITVQPLADLAIGLAASPNPARNKQNLTYTLTVSNAGPTTATGLVISDPLPAGTTFLSASASAGVTLSLPAVGANGTLVGKLASLGPNGSATVTLTVAANTKNTSISNTAGVSAGTPDPVTSNNAATLAVQVK